MPQEFQVLRCFACSTYQVQFVKKSSNKWQCKMCNEKQSLKQVFGRGTGQDCRLHVQKLNAQRLTNEEVRALPHRVEQSQTEERDQTFDTFLQPFQPVPAESKWSSFLQNEKQDDSSDEEDPFQKALRARDPQRIRKARAPKAAKQTREDPADMSHEGEFERKRPSPNVWCATAKKSKVEEIERRCDNPVSSKPAPATSKWGQFLAKNDLDKSEIESSLVKEPGLTNNPDKKTLFYLKQNAAPAVTMSNRKSKWGQFLQASDTDDNSLLSLKSCESEKMEMQCSDSIANKDRDPRATEQSVQPRESYKASTAAAVKRQGGIDFVLDENIEDDELDALLTL